MTKTTIRELLLENLMRGDSPSKGKIYLLNFFQKLLEMFH